MSIHKGHRERLKSRFRQEGLDNFDELYVLELLLFYCIPQKDTNPLAHKLLDYFGSLTAVLDAKPEQLEKVEGIGPNVSTFLSLITEVGRYYQVKRSEPGEVLRTIEQCGNYLIPYFFGREQENVFLLCLDAKCKVICCKKVGEGSVNSANISIRRIVEIALEANATSVVLAHNHPSGLAIPSADDIQTTYRVAAALEAVEVALADHIVVSKDDFVSIVQSQ
ncbi:MAG: DNA repair protein RadC, partial [Oscillospiraceae bacterium]|nr:DNA repair protein RadC [Oscillospiraceae bacterium]